MNYAADRPEPLKLRPAAMKPHKELHRLGYLPKYSSMLVDLAYERIKRMVQGEWDEDPALETDEDEDEEQASWLRPMLGVLRKEVQRQVVAWLYVYINGESVMLWVTRKRYSCSSSFTQPVTTGTTSASLTSMPELSMHCNRRYLNAGVFCEVFHGRGVDIDPLTADC